MHVLTLRADGRSRCRIDSRRSCLCVSEGRGLSQDGVEGVIADLQWRRKSITLDIHEMGMRGIYTGRRI
jgi:hypothetical protein